MPHDARRAPLVAQRTLGAKAEALGPDAPEAGHARAAQQHTTDIETTVAQAVAIFTRARSDTLAINIRERHMAHP